MKLTKFYLYIIAAGIVCATVSCAGENTEPAAPELTISVAALDFTNTAASRDIHIKSNVKWTITASDAWCTVSPASDAGGSTVKVTVSVSENRSSAARSATLTVTAGTQTKTVAVTQAKYTFLTVSPTSVTANADGGDVAIEVQASGDFTVATSADWISVGEYTGGKQHFTVAPNSELMSREETVTFTQAELSAVATIVQSGASQSVPADKTGMTRDALALAAQMTLGWNLGNTLEAPGNETAWGNPKTTEQMILMVKNAGINAIRLPCAWDSYLEDQTTYKIKAPWLARVKEVVDYCVDNGLYAIVNIHWDGGWLEENPTYAKQTEVNRKQRALWEQIAVYFRNYDEHLLFAGTNEVHAPDYSAPATEHLEVQMSYNQTFVDAVRSTGGRNAYRNLIVQSFSADIDEADSHLLMPADPTADRLMLEVHFYPWQFGLLTEDANSTWGKALYLWGDDYIQYENIPGLSGRASRDNEDYVVAQFDKIKTKFVERGCPAILGEYGAVRRPNLTGEALAKHLQSRAYFMEFVTREAKNHGLVPFAWDSGTTNLSDSPMTVFDRKNLTVFDQQLLDAILKGSREGVYPF
jgi:endoglucanase